MNANEKLMIAKARSLFAVPDDYWNSVFDPNLMGAALDSVAASASKSESRDPILEVFPDFWRHLRDATGNVTGGPSTLRPIWKDKRGNVLGRVWDTVVHLATTELYIAS